VVRWLPRLGLEPTAYRRCFDSQRTTVEHNLRPSEGTVQIDRGGDDLGVAVAGSEQVEDVALAGTYAPFAN
jgi:hypothetical protein